MMVRDTLINVLNKGALEQYNTFGIKVQAKNIIEINSEEELLQFCTYNDRVSYIPLGGGSNILFTKDIDKNILKIDIKGKTILKVDGNCTYIRVGAGENWHEFVSWCLKQNLGGVENLSLIPGNVGTTPIQNIGAYGVEIKDIFDCCEAINTETKEIEILDLETCQFGYRDSIFKSKEKEKYIIQSVTFKLTNTDHTLKMDYGAIQTVLRDKNVAKPTIRDISDAVIEIRTQKLPDPKQVGNAGSFFKNPVVSSEHGVVLLEKHPNMLYYPLEDGTIKIPAGWLIEKLGYKGKTYDTYGVHKNHASVLVNYGGATGKDIYSLACSIKDAVQKNFQITLEMEVNIF